MKAEKDNYFQILKAIAICGVVLSHSIGAEIRHIQDNGILEIIIRQFINYSLPVFLFISGYFVTNANFRVNERPFTFIRKRLKRLLIPYLLWSVIGIVLTKKFNLTYVIYCLFTGQAMFQLYYIVVLIQLIVLTPLIVRTLNNKKLIVLMLMVTPIYLGACYCYYFISNKLIDFPYNAIPFIPWFIFYYLGILFRSNQKVKSIITKYIGLTCLGYLVFLFLSIFEGLSIYRYNINWFDFAKSQIKFSSFSASFFFIWIAMYMKEKIQVNPRGLLIYIGNNSFGIFFIHIIVKKLLSMSGIFSNITNQVPYTALNTIVNICISLLLIFIVKKIMGEKISRVYFGL